MTEADLIAVRRDDGRIQITYNPGDFIRVSFGLLAHADAEWLAIEDGQLVFRGVNASNEPQRYAYRPVAVESGPEGGFLRCEPVP